MLSLPGIAGQPHARNLAVEVHRAQQIGQKAERAIHDAEEKRALAAIMFGQNASQLAHAGLDLRLRDKEASGFM